MQLAETLSHAVTCIIIKWGVCFMQLVVTRLSDKPFYCNALYCLKPFIMYQKLYVVAPKDSFENDKVGKTVVEIEKSKVTMVTQSWGELE